MASPTTQTRGTPSGIYLKRGGPGCKMTFAGDTDLTIYEVTVKPWGVDGGDPINITTQWNTEVVTKAEQRLKEITDGQITFAYDPTSWIEGYGQVNTNNSTTFLWPEGSTLDVWGYLKDLDYDPLSREEMPMGTATVVATNWDPVGKVEARPVITSVTGS